jgi:hypothetical protein
LLTTGDIQAVDLLEVGHKLLPLCENIVKQRPQSLLVKDKLSYVKVLVNSLLADLDNLLIFPDFL